MIKQQLIGVAMAAACVSASALTLAGSSTGNLDNRTELLAGLHLTDGTAFIDTFDFSVSAAGVAAASFLEGAFGLSGNASTSAFTFTALVLADAANNALAGATSIDVDGSDGWTVSAALPSGGNYRVLIGGVAPATVASGAVEQQYYVGLAATQVAAVPEPSSIALLAAGLAAMGGASWRRRGRAS